MEPTEAARRLGVSRHTVLHAVRAGKIPAVRINRRVVRIDPADLEPTVALRKPAEPVVAAVEGEAVK